MRQKSGPEKQPAEDAITAPLARCQGQRIKFRSAWVRYRFTCLSQRGQKPAIARASPPDPLIKDQADLNSSFAVFAPGVVHSTSAYCKAEGGKHDSSVCSSCSHGGGIFSKCG